MNADQLQFLGEFTSAVAFAVGLIVVFCAAILAAAFISYGTILFCRAIRGWWVLRAWQDTSHSPDHYRIDSDWVVLPRCWFERLLTPRHVLAWAAILHQFRHQPWPPRDSEVVVRLRNRKGQFQAAHPPKIRP